MMSEQRRIGGRGTEVMNEIPLLILVLFIIAVLLRLDIAFYLVYVLFGVYLTSRWWTDRGLRLLQANRRFTSHAFLGERITVDLQLRNPKPLPIPWLQLHESVPLALHSPGFVHQVTSLRPKQSATLTYELVCRRRGYYDIGPFQVSSGDLFGFASSALQKLNVDHLTVYPEIIPLTRLGLPSKSPFGTISTQHRVFEDPARPAGVRAYRAGDSLSRIHWKASAHEDALLVKRLDPSISLHTAIFLDLNLNEYGRRNRILGTEWAIVLAASIASHLAEKRQAVGLFTNGNDPALTGQQGSGGHVAPLALPPRTGRQHLMKILEILARVEAHDATPFAVWAQDASLPLSWGDTVMAITPIGDERTCQILHQLCRRGFNVVLLVVAADSQFGVVRQRARQMGFAALNVVNRRDLNRWRE